MAKKITNFGGNLRFQPGHYHEPRSEDEVLSILERHAEEHVRCVGSLHAWSDAVAADVIIDLKHLNAVEIQDTDEDGRLWVRAGAGCTLRRFLDDVHSRTDYTIPTLGGITRQTIAGAISTGTHGSGNHSLSHYMEEVRVAAFDEDGRPAVHTYTGGPELQAARCAVGCMGVILSVRFRCIPKYWIRENIAKLRSLDEVLESERRYPMQQFALLPYGWEYFVFQWEPLDREHAGRPGLKAYLHRALDLVGTDFISHLVLKGVLCAGASQGGSSRLIRWFYSKALPPMVAHRRNVTDRSDHMLTLAHDLFRHLEMELFVPAARLADAVAMLQALTDWFGGNVAELPPDSRDELRRSGLLEEVESRRGFYSHHYPFVIRRVLPDDTLISMTADAEQPYYSLSLFTYLPPSHRANFYRYADMTARVMCSLYDARLHWGKYFPLAHEDVARLYPSLPTFRELCEANDPNGVFQNDFTRAALGFSGAKTGKQPVSDRLENAGRP
ncbi:MAG: D-arabinono-1,4-lactone oxidase [Chloroflexota bacterium]